MIFFYHYKTVLSHYMHLCSKGHSEAHFGVCMPENECLTLLGNNSVLHYAKKNLYMRGRIYQLGLSFLSPKCFINSNLSHIPNQSLLPKPAAAAQAPIKLYRIWTRQPFVLRTQDERCGKCSSGVEPWQLQEWMCMVWVALC